MKGTIRERLKWRRGAVRDQQEIDEGKPIDR